jgi:hypothetical protein
MGLGCLMDENGPRRLWRSRWEACVDESLKNVDLEGEAGGDKVPKMWKQRRLYGECSGSTGNKMEQMQRFFQILFEWKWCLLRL